MVGASAQVDAGELRPSTGAMTSATMPTGAIARPAHVAV